MSDGMNPEYEVAALEAAQKEKKAKYDAHVQYDKDVTAAKAKLDAALHAASEEMHKDIAKAYKKYGSKT